MRFFLALLGLVGAVEFMLMEGRTADPCHKYIPDVPSVGTAFDTNFRRNCPTEAEISGFSNVVRIARTTTSGRQYTITAFGLPKSATTGIAFALDDDCKTVDPASIVQATTSTSGNSLTFNWPVRVGTSINYLPTFSSANTNTLGSFDRPRPICWSQTSPAVGGNLPWRYTGFKIAVSEIDCDPSATTGTAICTVSNLRGALDNVAQPGNLFQLNSLQIQLFTQKTSCCRTALVGITNVGVCYNPSFEGCCGGFLYELSQERCCNTFKGWIVPINGRCPCVRASQVDDCPPGEVCCLQNKWTSLVNNQQQGQCYFPFKEACCNTGAIYDPGAQQCCTITGIQSLDVPCPCDADTHCQGGQTFNGDSVPLLNRVCCQQWVPISRDDTTSTTFCSIYTNFPHGHGQPEIQRCSGFCIDGTYSICCNGVQCVKAYERCCNSTCCNKWSSTCLRGYRPAADGEPHNPTHFRDIWQICSTSEGMNTVKGFFIWVLPSGLLFASLVGLAIGMVFACKATPRIFSKIEYAMMFFAVITAFLAMTHYFSPIWYWGLWSVIVQVLIILGAAARVKWVNVGIVILNFWTLVFLFDPFFGNAWLQLPGDRRGVGFVSGVSAPPDVATSGVLHTVEKSWRNTAYCSGFYGWFRYDVQLRDTVRFDNPGIETFGYCSRGWGTALLFFAGIEMICMLIQLVLSLLGLVFRFRHDKVEFEVHEEPLGTLAY